MRVTPPTATGPVLPRRALYLCLIVICTALAHHAAPRAQPTGDPARIWTGRWVEHYADPQNGVRSETTVSYRLTENADANGLRVWTARTVQWAYRWELEREGTTVVGKERLGIDRFSAVRVKARIRKTCTTAGAADLGPGLGTDMLLVMPVGQEDRLKSSCVSTVTEIESGLETSESSGSGDRISLPGLPGDEEFQGCQYVKPWRTDRADGSHYEGTYTVTRAAGVLATMTIDSSPDSDYARFVPAPGKTLTVVASASSGKARFRFELDAGGTSRFPGYATNANVDDGFFDRFNLAPLRGQYTNDGPDVLFDPFHFAGADEWSRVEPLVVETAQPQNEASVTLTAMDYAAVGALRVFVSLEACGGWQPVPIRVGSRSVDALAIPMDDDGNLMADALAEYRGLDSGADEDLEPHGNGMHGDGLTAFEEYRGVLVRGARCTSEAAGRVGAIFRGPDLPPPTYLADEEHVRTSNGRKDVFVHAPDAELAMMVPAFAEATKLAVHLICEPHYVDNETRIVNFTLQQSRLFEWNGKRISQEGPQHGLRLEAVARLGGRGLSVPITEGDLGPPALTRTVQVLKPPDHVPCGGCGVEYPDVLHAVVHELGHSVGIPHHGDTVVDFRSVLGRQNLTTRLSLQQHAGGPPDFSLPDSLPDDPAVEYHYADVDGRQYLNGLLVAPGGDCVEGVANALFDRAGQFIGCEADSIARRGQQNSGDFECPMRYSGSSYYEAPGSVAQWAWTGLAGKRVYERPQFGYLVDAWNGRFLRYRNDLDRDGGGRFCTRVTGTGINGLPGDQNHTGDVAGQTPCADYLVVNDLAALRRR